MGLKSLALSSALAGFAGMSYADGSSADLSVGTSQAAIVSPADFTVKLNRTVTRKEVVFKKGNLKMAGVLFSPADMKQGATYLAVVVAHPGGEKLGQTANAHAYRLAQRGFIALTYNAFHEGGTEALPHLIEDPATRMKDVKNAVDYLMTLLFVDRNRIAAVGICADGAYPINATMAANAPEPSPA